MRVCMLGSGFNASFYATALLRHRSRDSISVVYSRKQESADAYAKKWNVANAITDLKTAVSHSDADVVVVALPNFLHEEAVIAAAEAGKPVLCTKPLGRTAEEAARMLQSVERAGVFHGYLEDLVFTPKTLKALDAVAGGAIGKVNWVRSRETHPGPHSDWFWNKELSGGGALVDMGCHCIEIARHFIGKNIRPLEVVCWADTQVHPIETEDHAIGLVRYANGAIGQFEVSWTFRGGMDLRDEISGSDGTIWLNHWLRTGNEMFSAVGQSGYVAEKAESSQGWLFPVGDEPSALGYVDMFVEMFDAIENGRPAAECFYDGYIVNSIMDAAYKSVKTKRWEPVELPIWRGLEDVEQVATLKDYDDAHFLVKKELLPDGTNKIIVRHKQSGEISQLIES